MKLIFNVDVDGGAYEMRIDVDRRVLHDVGQLYYDGWILISDPIRSVLFDSIKI